MDAAGFEQFVVVSPDNVFWLTNFANFVHERPFVLVVSRTGRLRFVVPRLEIPHVRARAVGQIELVPYCEFPAPAGRDWASAFSGLFDKQGRVGVEPTCPNFVQAALPCASAASGILDEARFIKTDYELARIRYACDIATVRMKKILEEAKPGASMLSVYSKTTKLTTLQLLLDNPAINMLATKSAAVVQPPTVSHDPHNFTNVLALGMEVGGPNVAIVAGVLNGYGCEIERTFFLGHVPEAARKPYETMMAARALAFDLCRPGASMHDVDYSVNELMRKAGYGDNLLHRTGHGIGVTGHEGPFLAEGFHHEIHPGMVFTIEPGLYIEGVGGFRHSDTIVVTEAGNASLTPLPDGLSAMTIPVRKSLFPQAVRFQKPLMEIVARLNGIERLGKK
jgi:Xaa-Pro dipeptidase